MFEFSPAVLGVSLVFLGLAFTFLTLLMLRLMPRLQPVVKAPAAPPITAQITHHNEAILLILSGGRVAYLNQQAREMFNVWDEEPNLESLARRTRPSEAFLTLCAGEGQARFSLNGRFVEGTSYYIPGSIGSGPDIQSSILVSLRRPQLVITGDVYSASTSTGDDQLSATNGSSRLGSARGHRNENATDEDLSSSNYRLGEISSNAFNTFSELSQAMAASLDLHTTLQTILESIERLLPSDFLEINIWNSDARELTPYRLVGLAGIDRRLEKASERYRADQGYSGHLISTLKPLLVKDISTFRAARPALDRQRFPYQSYLGAPLLIAGDFIGTLELASLTKENYSESDMEVLRLLAGQAAVALNNALLYRQELLRSRELAGLADLAQSASAIRDPQDLYSRLIESIAPLLNVEILGFLVYDENRRVIEGQSPFMGLQPSVVEWCQATIPPDSPAESIWLSAETILATDAPKDETIQSLGLHNLALAAGIRQTVLMPLTSGGHMLGYIQAANKRDNTPFDSDDLRLLSIIAGQAAPIIENATLVQQSRKRAQRSETLRRIASLTSSSATLDEILKFSILDLARLLQADVAAIYLLDESRGELRLHRGSVFGISPEVVARLGRIPTDAPEFSETITSSKQQFISGDLSEEIESIHLYRPIVDELKVRSAINVPLVMRERGIGELMVGSLRTNFFSRGDVQSMATAAGQLAVAIERAWLYSQTDQNLRQRVEQLTALTRISRELNSTTKLNDLLQRVYDEALRTTQANCGTILLFDIDERPVDSEDAENAHLLLYLGDEPGSDLHLLEKAVLHTGESLIISDFQTTPVTIQGWSNARVLDTVSFVGQKTVDTSLQAMLDFEHQEIQPAHRDVRSALIVPIAYQGQVAGLIHLHAKEPDHFGEAEREIGEALAIQAAIALGNAQRYQEQQQRSHDLNQRVETLSRLLEVSQTLQTEQSVEQSLEAIAYAIQAATPFDIVLISVYDAQMKHLVRTAAAGIPLNDLARLREHQVPWESVIDMLKPQFRTGHLSGQITQPDPTGADARSSDLTGRVYFIPSEYAAETPSDIDYYYPKQPLPRSSTFKGEWPQGSSQQPVRDRWNADDILAAPLINSAGEPLGLISVDSPRDGSRPDQTIIETLEIFSSQAALIIENQTKVRELRSQMGIIQNELDLARQSAEKAQSHLPALLQKDLEHTLAIQYLSQRANRINSGLDIAEIISKQSSREAVLATLGHETLTRMDFDIVLIAEPTAGGLSLTSSIGAIPADVNPKALLGQRNPLRHCLHSGDVTLVSNLVDDDEWSNAPLLRALDTKSFLCLPILDTVDGKGTAGKRSSNNGVDKPRAALLAVSRTQIAPFTPEDRQVFELLTRQVAVAIQNLGLLEDTSRRLKEVNLLLDFSRQLGGLDPINILNNLIDSVMKAVTSAQLAMVVLWDARQGLLIPQVATGYAHSESLMQVQYRVGEGLAGQVFEQMQPVNLEELDFARHYNLSPENLLHYRDATAGRLPVSSMAVPIMAGTVPIGGPGSSETVAAAMLQDTRNRPLGVLVIDSIQTTAAFTSNDLAVVTSLAQQTALTLENARLYQNARQRSSQLQALTNVATTITSSLQPQELVLSLLDQLQAILPYDTGTLWLAGETSDSGRQTAGGKGESKRMSIRAARGFADSEQRVGLTVDIEDSRLLNEMNHTGRPIWVPDVRLDSRFQTLAMGEFSIDGGQGADQTPTVYENLSWLGVPLITSGQVIGVIALEKAEANAYTPDDIQVATTFAGQAAVGLENAELYQQIVQRVAQLDQRSQTLAVLNRLSYELSGSLDAARILDYAVQEFMVIMNCDSASALMWEEMWSDWHSAQADGVKPGRSRRIVLRAEYPYAEGASPYYPGYILPNAPIFDRLRETQGIFNIENVSQEADLAPLHDFLAYHETNSLLVVPIVGGSASDEDGADRRFHGALLVHKTDSYRFSEEEINLARTFSNQVAIALQNALLLEETLSLTEDLENRVQLRTAELGRERQRAETLLRIITELSASLDLEQVLNRTLQVLSEYVDAAQITILIARPGDKKLHRLASVGYSSESAQEKIARRESFHSDGIHFEAVTPLDVDQGLAGWIISQRQSVLINDVLEDERWIQLAYPEDAAKSVLQHRSAIGVPLMSGAEALGCLLLFHPETDHFSMDQLDLVQAAANQVAVAVNNAELYRLIRDQAEDLGNMLRSQQIETSRSKAILEAVADGVLVTDANRTITLFNESAEKILGLERSSLLGKSMEHFSGLFGRATRSWMQTIATWSQDPSSYAAGDTFAEQYTLEDGRVISVHLAPVSLRNDFLGTVSIFQDITHQVEVDRLKSEFVATVSHELRTPMTSIKGYVEVLLMGAAGSLTETQTHFLQVVKTNTERLAVLVNDLLDISQIEAGRVKLSLQPLNLEEVTDQAISELQRRTQGNDKAVTVHKEFQPGLPRVNADRERIRRVLDNMLDNAYQYNLPGGRITVRLQQSGDAVQIDIKDSGVGIPPQDQERVFERFFRGESTLNLGVAGTGLGLSIVQNLIHMHGGRIWLESSGIPGEGSTFSFTLPVYSPEQEERL